MESFTISFWKAPVSKDDSTLELQEAGLIHAIVSRTAHSNSTRYAVDLQDPEMKNHYGRIVLSKSMEDRWMVVNSLNNMEDIFMQLTAAIESAEVSLSPSNE